VPGHGEVITADIPGTLSGSQARPAEVYLPPAFFDAHRPPLPVMVLLSGSPGTPSDWTRAAFADVTLDRWAAKHPGISPIVVTPAPNGSPLADTECANGGEGNAEDYLIKDVRSYMVPHFDAPVDRRMWAVGGLSEGGFCAMELGLRHPELFSVFMN